MVKSFHKKIWEDKTNLNWLPMRSTGLWFVFIVISLISHLSSRSYLQLANKSLANCQDFNWRIKDIKMEIKQSWDLSYVELAVLLLAEPLVRISILANIYRTSQSGHTTHSSLISTIARLCRRSVLTLAVFSRRFISIFIWWDLIVHIPYGGLLLLSHVDTLAPPTPQSG